MKGIILSGGSGSRLYPITLSISKQIIPIYDKPMVYYPLSVLMLAGIRDIMIITNKEYLKIFKNQLGNGRSLGIKISYKIQKKPNGIPEAFLIAKKFIENQNVLLILGDNLFYGQELSSLLKKPFNKDDGAKIFLHQVKNPNSYGVVEFYKKNKIKKIIEKPKEYISNFAVTGMYMFDQKVISLTKKLKPSKRNELEITNLLNFYLKKNKLNYEILGRGHSWFDAGTHDSLLSASEFIKAVEDRQGYKIGCIEEIAYNNNWVNKLKLKKIIFKYKNSPYGEYLKKIINNN